MPLYAYKSLDSSGKSRTSEIEAATEEQARSILRNRGIPIMKLQVVQGGAAGEPVRRKRRVKVPVDQQAVLFQQLAVMIRAGIPLTDALNGLREQQKSLALGEALGTVHQDLTRGASLSAAIQAHPGVFPKLAADMIAVAEAGGNLSDSLDRLAAQLEANADIARKVKSAMSYPIIVLVISALTLVALLTFILPRFLVIFDQMKLELPMSTRMLLAISQSTRSYWYAWLIGVAAVAGGARGLLVSPSGRRAADRFLLHAPVIGDLYTKVVTARVLTTLATLLQAGVPMMDALETAGTAANNEVVRSALRETQRELAAGVSLSASLKKAAVFPALVVQVTSAGEQTGELASMLTFACDYYSREVDAKLKSLTSIIEPVMIVGLGALVGFIAVSIIVPIYSLVGGVK